MISGTPVPHVRANLMSDATERGDVLRKILRSWFELTRDEQKVLVLILALFLLGLTVRFWHLRKERADESCQTSHPAQQAKSERK